MQFDPAAQSVGDVMTAAVVTVPMDESLEVIQEIFDHARFHHLLVMEGHTLTGIISDRDALKALSPYVGTISETHRDRATLHKRAHQIMSHRPVVIDQSCSVQEAAQLMILRGISCLPVTTSDGAVRGVVTSKDLLTAFWAFTTS